MTRIKEMMNKIHLPCWLKRLISQTEYASIKRAGILPRELKIKKLTKLTFPMAAARLINPEGMNGINRIEKISRLARLPRASTNAFNLGYFTSFCWAASLNPFRYNKNASPAPIASPRKESKVPFQKPKKRILAAVRKKLGRKPIKATSIPVTILINIAAFGY